ncbi:MAG: Holliday junction resolvase [Thermoplasmata archaeon]
MRKRASVYERELKEIFAGNRNFILKFTRTMLPEVRENYEKILRQPFLVIRSGGSLGVDLVAVRYDLSFPVEVKTSNDKTIHFSADSGRANEQAEKMRVECVRSGLVPLYAYRIRRRELDEKGEKKEQDPWCVFTLGDMEAKGRLIYVYQRLPKITKSQYNSFVMHFEEGMPLNLFLSYICMDAV